MKGLIAGIAVLVIGAAGLTSQTGPAPRGVALADLAWPDAEAWLTPSMVVAIPLGAGALEQGRHMKLNSDERLARHLAARVQAASTVAIAPLLTYHAYGAYADYPGSTSLGETAARDMTVEAVRSLAKFGPRRFYVLNTSAATLGALQSAARTLADAGILLGYTDPAYWTRKAGVLQQSSIAAAHADEASTSMMLFVDPAAVDMTRAMREYPGGRGAISKSGVYGDPTLATVQKGRVLVDTLLAGILEDIDSVRNAPLPPVRNSAPLPPPPPPARPAMREEPKGPNGCTAGDERAIRNVGAQFTYYWAQLDALGLSQLFTGSGDIRHPDGSIERGQETILSNRTQLFLRSEYAGSKHPVQLNDVRCLGSDTAIADGKWELRLERNARGPGRGLNEAANNAGWCTLIVVKRGAGWQIEAWRYTVNPPEGAPPPTLLSKPGYIGRGGV